MKESEAVAALLTDENLRRVFETVLTRRKVRFNELKQKCAEEDLDEELDRLKGLALIDETPASLPDYQTYFVTAEGLSIARELHRVEHRSSGSYGG